MFNFLLFIFISYNLFYSLFPFCRKKRALSDWLIAPNTKWCGRGQTADKYSQLGGASKADKCCRRHDHCKFNIYAMTTKWRLFNFRPFTISHCSCDMRFVHFFLLFKFQIQNNSVETLSIEQTDRLKQSVNFDNRLFCLDDLNSFRGQYQSIQKKFQIIIHQSNYKINDSYRIFFSDN